MAKKLTDAEKKAREKEKKQKAVERKKLLEQRKKERKALAEAKTAFRASKEWKQFRRDLVVYYDATCQLCGCKYASKSLVCHHKFIAKDGADYADISDPKRFTILCSSCHKYAHYMGNKASNKSDKVAKIKEAIRPVLGDEWTDLKDKEKK